MKPKIKVYMRDIALSFLFAIPPAALITSVSFAAKQCEREKIDQQKEIVKIRECLDILVENSK